jgi:cell wall-associated NlpC family hydrolase
MRKRSSLSVRSVSLVSLLALVASVLGGFRSTAAHADAPQGEAIVNAAASQAGLPYCWDGGNMNGPTHGGGGAGCGGGAVGFDCTGLTLYAVYQATGRVLSHDGRQATEGGQVISSEANLQPGDLVFFGGSLNNFDHAGVYIGNGMVWDAADYNIPVQKHSLAWIEHGLPFVGGARYWTSGGPPPSGPPSVAVGNNNGQMAVQLANFPTGISYFFCHTGSGYPAGGAVPNHGSVSISSSNQSWSSGWCSGSGNFWVGIQATDGHDYYSNQVTLGSGSPSITISNNNGDMAVQLADFPNGTSYFFCHTGSSDQWPIGGNVTYHSSVSISSSNQSWSSGWCSGSGNFWVGIQATDGHDYYSNQVTLGPPATVPGPPLGLSVTPGNSWAAVSWVPPSNDGGSTITRYTAHASPGGARCSTVVVSCTVSGLTNGADYSFTVTASNEAGDSPASAASATVRPRTVPDPPTGVVAEPADNAATVDWIAPSFDGGVAIRWYRVTAFPSGRSCLASAAAHSCRVAKLANGRSYRFVVAAGNAAGRSTASSASLPIVAGAATAPRAPTISHPRAGVALVTWRPPTSSGSGPVRLYQVRWSLSSANGWSSWTRTKTRSVIRRHLRTGRLYAVEIRAVNGAGAGTPVVKVFLQ